MIKLEMVQVAVSYDLANDSVEISQDSPGGGVDVVALPFTQMRLLLEMLDDQARLRNEAVKE